MDKVLEYKGEAPVLFLIFNRLETTKLVFNKIAAAKPNKLYLASDGARASKNGEADVVNEVRKYVLSKIDWDCEVKTLFRDDNLGCKKAVSGAISWFFEQEESGIILEDDCLPADSFFGYAETLLEKYKDTPEVKMISGDGRRFYENTKINSSYVFVKYPMVWGWASWRRTWNEYDVNMTDFPAKKEKILAKFSRKQVKRFWDISFGKTYRGEIDTWDYQFAFSILKNDGKCISPVKNQISNIGFGDMATHTSSVDSELANIPTYEMSFPLQDPVDFSNDLQFESLLENANFYKPGYSERAANKFRRMLKL